jgi:hypothetical protein
MSKAGEVLRLMENEPTTIKLRNGTEVTARWYKSMLMPITYSNRTQANNAVKKLGPGWTVYQFGRPFYAGREK